MDIKLIEVKSEESKPESLSLKSKEPKPQPEYTAEDVTGKITESKSFEKYDKIVLKSKSEVEETKTVNNVGPKTPTLYSIILNPVYNTVGKFLGIESISDWRENHQKVMTITDWASEKSKSKDMAGLVTWLDNELNKAPSFGMNHKRIDQLYMWIKLKQA